MGSALAALTKRNQSSATNGRVLSAPASRTRTPLHGGHMSAGSHAGGRNRRPGKYVAFGNIHVTVKKGNFYDEKADVIMNMAAPDMDLTKGGSSKALLQAAGSSVQTECYTVHPQGTQVSEGELVVTGPGKLKCRKVYHVVLPTWKQYNSGVLTSIIEKCLITADKYKVKTVVCPDLGTGFHGFPSDVSAAALFQGIANFSSSHRHSSIITVTFVVQASRTAQYSAFESEARKQNRKTQGGGPSQQCTAIGNLSISVVMGELCNQKVDIIVSNTGTDLQLKNGGLSESLLKVAGDGLQIECDKNYANGIQPGDVAVTDGYNLKCKKVYHGSLPKWDPTLNKTQELEQFVSSCLNMADSHNSRSIAFPTLGTGSLSYPVDVSAQCVCQCIKTFQTNHPSTATKDIRIVVYDKASNCSSVKQAFITKLKALSTQQTFRPTVPKNLQPIPAQPQTVPNRGTKAYWLHKYQEDLHPPSYWTTYSDKKSLKKWNSQQNKSQNKYVTVPVDQKTKDVITKLVESTWKQSLIGAGRDATGLDKLSFTKLSVKSVERIENPMLFEKYTQERAQLFSKASSIGQFIPMEKIANSSGPVLTTLHITPSDLTHDMYPEINEHYMFHGTESSRAAAIMNNGFDPRLAGPYAMIGQGVYCAESSTKSDQYADPVNQRTLQNKKMLLVRMCLGEIHSRNTAAKLKRPPCTSCHSDTCTNHTSFYDSVVVDGLWIFREFIVYEKSRCYPEYLISYDRV